MQLNFRADFKELFKKLYQMLHMEIVVLPLECLNFFCAVDLLSASDAAEN